MAKQDSYVRTQVRMPEGLYSWVKDYSERNNLSINESMNILINEGLHEKIFSDDNLDNRNDLIELIKARLNDLDVHELQSICNIIVRISSLKKGY